MMEMVNQSPSEYFNIKKLVNVCFQRIAQTVSRIDAARYHSRAGIYLLDHNYLYKGKLWEKESAIKSGLLVTQILLIGLPMQLNSIAIPNAALYLFFSFFKIIKIT